MEGNYILAWQLDPFLKIGMDMVVDPKNTPTEDIFIFLKIQDVGLGSKSKMRP